MQLFYTPDIKDDEKYFLSDEESMHCIHVLRYNEGQIIKVTDGKGSMFEARIELIAKKQVEISVIKRIEIIGDRSYRIHIAIAPTKNIERFEWFIEKATEIGIDEITPIVTEKSERKTVRIDRLEKIAIAAMKQSMKAYLPSINRLSGFSGFKQSHPPRQYKVIAHCCGQERPLLQTGDTKGKDVVILIGPEGDFSRREIDQATALGFRPISLGGSRLRTETAGIVACSIIYFMN